MNVLITASIGLLVDNNDTYYLQVIPAETESNWIIPITKDVATSLSAIEELETSTLLK